MTRRVPLALALALGAAAAPAAGSLPAAPPAPHASGAGVTVAVLDTGVALTRPELRGQIWTNPGEIAGNGRDDDGNGVVDDVHGTDFANGDGVPADDNGHGTHVAGIIAAHGAVTGLAPGATILPVKVLDDHNAGNAHWLAQGIAYAVARGARILNVSVNGDGASAELESAIRDAEAAGAVIVASAGNDGRDLATRPSYPVSYPESAVIGVGATNSRGALATFSNRGPGVDVLAPGADILSLGSPGLAYRSGTSMAAAFVSATLARNAAAAPGLSMSALQAKLPSRLAAGATTGPARATRAVKRKARRPHHRRKKHRASRRAARPAARR
ncbi:MAG: hypothetical protein QOK06_3132 [Acidimicrobiaceae bacterium]|jgi:subtilisin family serine protease